MVLDATTLIRFLHQLRMQTAMLGMQQYVHATLPSSQIVPDGDSDSARDRVVMPCPYPLIPRLGRLLSRTHISPLPCLVQSSYITAIISQGIRPLTSMTIGIILVPQMQQRLPTCTEQ